MSNENTSQSSDETKNALHKAVVKTTGFKEWDRLTNPDNKTPTEEQITQYLMMVIGKHADQNI